MVAENILKHLLCDDDSLMNYFEAKEVVFSDVKRRLFLRHRSEDRSIPDHHYRLQQELSFDKIESIGDVVHNGLFNLAAEFLEMNGDRIAVEVEKQNRWQELVTYVPPLVLQMAFLQKKKSLTEITPNELKRYFNELILPNIKFTALCGPEISPLVDFLKAEKGFDDLHIHLNGTTETDIAWLDFLAAPKKIYRELKDVYDRPGVREQFDQESRLLNPKKLFKLLNIARKIRIELCENLLRHSNSITERNFSTISTLVRSSMIEDGSFQHPLSKIISPQSVLISEFPIAEEGLLHVIVFRDMSIHKDCSRDRLYHFYLLILGLCNRLLVQQKHQFGFEQFQKHTLNGLRETSEIRFKSRFLQLHGNNLQNLNILEGRFSPKKSTGQTTNFLFLLKEDLHQVNKICLSFGSIAPELRLIAHFIKRKDVDPDKYIRHKELRKDVWERAEILQLFKNNNPAISKSIVGIDAAASEFDTPPEVFAPAFRMLRRKGFKHFTFHAGEDFHHLVSGLRVIFEAIVHNELGDSDRIGHATAAGLSPQIWCDVVGETILIRQGEWIDNLIFCRYLILNGTNSTLRLYILEVEETIRNLSNAIFKKEIDIEILQKAWFSRKFCPIMLNEVSLGDAKMLSVFDNVEWQESAEIKSDLDVKQVLDHYHHQLNAVVYDKIITVNNSGLFCPENMKHLQHLLLKIMKDKNIIIETLPASNVRIGHHRDFSTYQLWNWLLCEETYKITPPIIVGTDDAGIFATNIFNEYSTLYCYLTTYKKYSSEKAMAVVKGLHRNGRNYKFK